MSQNFKVLILNGYHIEIRNEKDNEYSILRDIFWIK
jgi:hypothetical protein